MGRRASYLLLGALALAACVGSQVPPVTPAQAQAAQARFPGATVAELDQGRSLYLSRCSVCHQPVVPSRFPAEEWPAHVAKMRERAHVSDAEAASIERYLVSAASLAPR